MQGDFSVLPGVIALGTGILAGIVLSIHFIRRALDRHRGAVVYLILGLMAGSLYSIAMGPTSLVNPLPALSPSNFDLPGFLLGILIVFFLNWLGREKKEKERKGRKQEQPAA